MNSKDKNRLNDFIRSESKSLQKQILDICELVFPQEENYNWDVFRKQILDVINDQRRRLEKQIRYNYSVEFTPSDIIKIYNRYNDYDLEEREGNE